jgi:uncharacterized protein GlcG (DUF336 family)
LYVVALALGLIERVKEEAAQRELGIAICVVDAADHEIAMQREDLAHADAVA